MEQAVYKAQQKARDRGEHPAECLRGAVMSSDAFFPSRDCIDMAGQYGITAVVWPAGSKNDAEIIEAANENKIALGVTRERCFSHH